MIQAASSLRQQGGPPLYLFSSSTTVFIRARAVDCLTMTLKQKYIAYGLVQQLMYLEAVC